MIIPNDNQNNSDEQTMMITEQGDMGLGLDPLSKKDQEAYNESNKNN